jgi:hypothetical protein
MLSKGSRKENGFELKTTVNVPAIELCMKYKLFLYATGINRTANN